MNKRTVALTNEQYKKIIETIRNGFICPDGHVVKPNKRIATALLLEANLGLRISDILQLRLSAIIRDGNRYRLNIVEKKTQKKREFTVPIEIYSYIQNYVLENNINPAAKLFDLSERTVQNHLQLVCGYLNFDAVSTHSFRKFFATISASIAPAFISSHYTTIHRDREPRDRECITEPCKVVLR